MIYLAIPYTHRDPAVEAERFQMANKIAAELMAKGYHVFSPISHSHPIKEAGGLPGTWDFWEQYDRRILSICDAIFVICLPGWAESKGVQAEIRIALELGIEVKFLSYVNQTPPI